MMKNDKRNNMVNERGGDPKEKTKHKHGLFVTELTRYFNEQHAYCFTRVLREVLKL